MALGQRTIKVDIDPGELSELVEKLEAAASAATGAATSLKEATKAARQAAVEMNRATAALEAAKRRPTNRN